MNNKKTKLFVIGSISLGVLAATAVVNFGGLRPLTLTNAADDSVWHHYSAVSATFTENGIKEYWVNCTTHEHVFEAPVSDNIVDKGAPSADFINSLDVNDDRLIVRHDKIVDFEDGENRYVSIYDKFSTIEVVNGEGINGSKALKITNVGGSIGDGHLNIDLDYLDAVFADPNVESLSFYAKGTNVTNNFRHYGNDAALTGGYADVKSCFEPNISGFGIDTHWKQFFLVRGVYENMQKGNWAIQYNITADTTLWLDDFRVQTYGYGNAPAIDFEGGGVKTDGKIRFASNYQNSDNYVSLSTDSHSTFEATNERASQGQRSLKVHKNSGYTAFYLGTISRDSLPENGILFDIYLEGSSLNATNGAICDGTNGKFLAETGNPRQDTWLTFNIRKSQITNDGRFFIVQFSTVMNIYIDNIRVADEIKYSFENSYAYHAGENSIFTSYTLAEPTAANILTVLDYGQCFELGTTWNGVDQVEVVEGFASDGDFSAKLHYTKYGRLLISQNIYKAMDDDSTITFDLYTEDVAWLNEPYTTPVKGQWNTYTITKGQLVVDGKAVMLINSGAMHSANTTIYIDNLTIKF